MIKLLSHVDGSGPVFDKKTPTVFVFGSNTLGIHGGGAAKAANSLYGYPWGKSEGIHFDQNTPTIGAMGIPTKIAPNEFMLEYRALRNIKHAFKEIEWSPRNVYFFTKIGCVLAGLDEARIKAQLFECMLELVRYDSIYKFDLPEDWFNAFMTEKQHEHDALMLEFHPEKMSDAEVKKWADNQIADLSFNWI